MLQRFQDFVTGITVCYKSIQRIKSAEMEELGLKGIHVMCLFFLYHNEDGITAAQLCQLCAEDKAAISRALSTLQEKGYLASTTKKYRSKLKLSQEGILMAEKINSLVEPWVMSGGDGLSEDERNTFYHALGVISNNLSQSLEK